MPNNTGNSRPFNPNAPWLGGYRRGFEPRPGETDAQRLKREMAELERRARNRKKYGSDYSHYKNAAGGEIKPKPKPKPMPMPTNNKKAKPLAKGGMARPGIDTSTTVDPREDIVVTAPRNTPKFKKLPKDSPGFSAVKKMPKGSPGFDFGGTSAETTPKPKIKKLPKGSFKSGGSVSASRRADGIARKGKTRGKVL